MTCRQRRPITTASSASCSMRSDCGSQHDRRTRADHAARRLEEQERRLRHLGAGAPRREPRSCGLRRRSSREPRAPAASIRREGRASFRRSRPRMADHREPAPSRRRWSPTRPLRPGPLDRSACLYPSWLFARPAELLESFPRGPPHRLRGLDSPAVGAVDGG